MKAQNILKIAKNQIVTAAVVDASVFVALAIVAVTIISNIH